MLTFRAPGFSDGTCTQPPGCLISREFVVALALSVSASDHPGAAAFARSSHSAPLEALTVAVRFVSRWLADSSSCFSAACLASISGSGNLTNGGVLRRIGAE